MERGNTIEEGCFSEINDPLKIASLAAEWSRIGLIEGLLQCTLIHTAFSLSTLIDQNSTYNFVSQFGSNNVRRSQRQTRALIVSESNIRRGRSSKKLSANTDYSDINKEESILGTRTRNCYRKSTTNSALKNSSSVLRKSEEQNIFEDSEEDDFSKQSETSDQPEEDTSRSLRMQLLQARMMEGSDLYTKRQPKSRKSSKASRESSSSFTSVEEKKHKKKSKKVTYCVSSIKLEQGSEFDNLKSVQQNNDTRSFPATPALTLRLSKLQPEKWLRKSDLINEGKDSAASHDNSKSSVKLKHLKKNKSGGREYSPSSPSTSNTSDDTIENVPNMEVNQSDCSSGSEDDSVSNHDNQTKDDRVKSNYVSKPIGQNSKEKLFTEKGKTPLKLSVRIKKTDMSLITEKGSRFSPSSASDKQKKYENVSSGESTEIEEYNDIAVDPGDSSPLHKPVSLNDNEITKKTDSVKSSSQKSRLNVEKSSRKGGDDKTSKASDNEGSKSVDGYSSVPSVKEETDLIDSDLQNSSQKRKPGRTKRVPQISLTPLELLDDANLIWPKQSVDSESASSKRSRKKQSGFKHYDAATPRRKQKSPRRIIVNVDQNSMYDNEIDSNYDVGDEALEDTDGHTEDKTSNKKSEWTKDCPEGNADNKSLKNIMKKLGKLNCPQCGKEVRNFQYYQFHIEWCGREDEVVVCPICNKKQRLMYMASHTNLHKRKERIEMERQKQVQSDASAPKSQRKRKAAQKAIGSLHVMSQELFSTDEMGDSRPLKRSRHFNLPDDHDASLLCDDNFATTTSSSHGGSTRGGGGSSMWPSKDEDLFEECLQYHTKLEVLLPAFDEFLPTRDMFYHLQSHEIDTCLPITRKSIDFAVELGNKVEPASLGLFGSTVSGDSINFFTGGPVWCAVWCPIPTTEGIGADQYVAVYSHKHMDETNVVKKAFSKTTVIQIWNCGPLNAFSEKLFLPHLAYGIVHDFGCVFSMSWCPFGAWQSCSQSSFQEGSLRRLGLLAAACSDGSVRIFSVPYASDLLDKDQLVGTYQFFRVKPSISLIPLPDMSGSSGSCCLCVDWQHGEERRYVVAGYADGATRIWDLKTQSPLLRTSINLDMTDVFLYPIRCFKSHLSEVRAVCWSQTVHDTFVTCGADRDVKFWRTSDTSFPFCCEKFCQCMSARWVQPWNGVVVAQDDAFCYDHCCAFYQDAGLCYPDLYGRRSVMWHNACIWDVSHSSWLNVAVTCDSTGTLMMFKCMNLWKGNKSKKLMYRRHLLFETEVIPSIFRDSNKDSDSFSFILEPRTYDEVLPRCSLVYKDKKMDVIKPDAKFGSGKHLPREKIGAYPIAALYKVNFNPNFGSCSWLLSAGQAGLVRLHNLSGLFSVQQRRLWTLHVRITRLQHKITRFERLMS
ncbi:general transcription factor 3C polypeptide 2-like isoform X2 [Octopus vulgaris]|uniref:General transcription factor 3C polypeptide 2-like isoform X2 n=1 Tax=Octopus vulgaris TaxID=6645 RepID=A0AA36FJY0_OCTVU|nr:general transcription factor 3C polypeptide 2-like isoform X2 [Octopus vulgaris]